MIEKAIFYDNKFQFGNFEGEDSVVRKEAVRILLQKIQLMEKSTAKESYINGEFVRTNRKERWSSPSSFRGGGTFNQKFAIKNNEDRPENATIDRQAFEGTERRLKPFAEFCRPELVYLNKPQVKDYLPKPKRIKSEKTPAQIAQNKQQSGAFEIVSFQKGEPFRDTFFKNVALRAKMLDRNVKRQATRLITHLSETRTVPIRDFQHLTVTVSI